MKLRRPTLLLPLLALSACEYTAALEDVATISLTPVSPSVDVGLSIQFEARAFNTAGEAILIADFTWTSSDPAVATVTAEGLAQGIGTGTTAISVTAGSASASQPLVVEPSQCLSRVDVILSPGQFQSYDGDTCLFLPTGLSGDRYRVAVTRPTLIEDPADVPLVSLAINPILLAEQLAGTSPAPAMVAPSPRSTAASLDGDRRLLDGTRFVEELGIRDATRRFHAKLREGEDRLSLRSTAVLASRPQLAPGPSLVDPPARADLFLGVDITCQQTESSPVLLIDFNDDVAIYQDSAQSVDEEPLDPSAAARMLDFYADYVRDFIEDYWGVIPDTDSNGRLILTTSTALPDSAAAGVFSGDFRPNTAAGCPGSNEGEVMYFDLGVINDMATASPSYLALSVMAHEAKHVTSLFNSLARNPMAFHPLWIEEGTAEISQTMASRIAWAAVGGPALGANIDGNDIVDWANDPANGGIGPEMWGLVGQISDLVVNLSTQPNSFTTNPVGASEYHTFYAGAWHWHRFMGDAYGNAATPLADSTLFRTMTDSNNPAGTQAHAMVTGRSYAELFEELVVAMSLHNSLQPEPTRSFTTWNLVSVGSIFASPVIVSPPHFYPWPVTTNVPSPPGPGQPRTTANPAKSYARGVYSCPPQLVGTGDDEHYEAPGPNDRCPIGPSGIRFHEFVSTGTGAGAQVQVTGAETGKIVITRLR